MIQDFGSAYTSCVQGFYAFNCFKQFIFMSAQRSAQFEDGPNYLSLLDKLPSSKFEEKSVQFDDQHITICQQIY